MDAAIMALDAERIIAERQLADIKNALQRLRRQEGQYARWAGSQGQRTSAAILDVMKNSTEPMTAQEITGQASDVLHGISPNAVSSCINRLKNAGIIQSVTSGKPKRWRVCP